MEEERITRGLIAKIGKEMAKISNVLTKMDGRLARMDKRFKAVLKSVEALIKRSIKKHATILETVKADRVKTLSTSTFRKPLPLTINYFRSLTSPYVLRGS